jgi:hypothetical protein
MVTKLLSGFGIAVAVATAPLVVRRSRLVRLAREEATA